MSGYIKIPRDLLRRALTSSKGRLTGEQALLWLMLEASWAERDYDVAGAQLRLARGQLACSVRYLAAAWHWPKATVHDFLKRLKANNLITTAPVSLPDTCRTPIRTPITLISICNYECWPEEQRLIPDASRQTPIRSPDKTEEENKKKNRERGTSEKERSRKKPAAELSDSWSPNQQSIQHGESLGLSASEISREAQKFRNHAKQNARTAVRWDSAFDNWLIKAAEFLNKSPPQQTANGSAQILEFKAMPNSPAFQAWRTHYRDNGMNAMVRELDRRVEENRAFSFPAEWPPNHAAGGAP